MRQVLWSKESSGLRATTDCTFALEVSDFALESTGGREMVLVIERGGVRRRVTLADPFPDVWRDETLVLFVLFTNHEGSISVQVFDSDVAEEAHLELAEFMSETTVSLEYVAPPLEETEEGIDDGPDWF